MPAPGVAPDTVLEVVQKGYELNERLLRAAKVLVARGEGLELAVPLPHFAELAFFHFYDSGAVTWVE